MHRALCKTVRLEYSRVSRTTTQTRNDVSTRVRGFRTRFFFSFHFFSYTRAKCLQYASFKPYHNNSLQLYRTVRYESLPFLAPATVRVILRVVLS